jgi:hypothetical protein
MRALRDVHRGQTATIVGKGPSILCLKARDFPPGPVITINHAILVVRQLHLAQPVYAMEKDGCIPHASGTFPVPVDRCVCPSTRMVRPVAPEHVLLSAAESSLCHVDYPARHLFDAEADFGLPWNTMSVPVAARIAAYMGCARILMLGHDAFYRGDRRRIERSRIIRSSGNGYRRAALQAVAYAKHAGVPIEFR